MLSPLKQSNKRREILSSRDDEKKFWIKIRNERIMLENSLNVLNSIDGLLLREWKSLVIRREGMRRDDIGVKKFGILNEYLFKQQREFLQKFHEETFPANVGVVVDMGSLTIKRGGRETEESQDREKTEENSPVSVPAPAAPTTPFESLLRMVTAVSRIQRYYRRFTGRRKERLEEVKALAETETIDSREKLRKRRLERHRPAVMPPAADAADINTVDKN